MQDLKQVQKFIMAFDQSFQRAIENPENIRPNGTINWDFVDADVYMDICETFGDLSANLSDLYQEEFDFAVQEQISEIDDYVHAI